MRIVDLDQNSSAWLQWRHTGLGSSDAPAVLGVSPWTSREQLWEEKVYQYHRSKPVLSGAQMARIAASMAEREARGESSKNRGKKLEPVARELYEAYLGHQVPTVCGVHVTHDFLKVSLDGWNPDKKLFAEIKAPNQNAHSLALGGAVPTYYSPQILHQFLVSGAQHCDYISFHDKMPPGHKMAVVRINEKTAQKALGIDLPLTEMIDRLFRAESEFWDSIVKGEYIPFGD